jgi:hypothetical protein
MKSLDRARWRARPRLPGATAVIADLFSQVFSTIQALFINIPVDNTLGSLYVVLNTLSSFLITILFGGSTSGGSGGILGGLFGGF